MYIETIPRQLGGLASHLLHTGKGSNERVIVRSDLSRDMPADVALGLRLLAAPARRIRRMKRDIVHIVASPERHLTQEEVERMLGLYEAEYRIPASNARLVVEHAKGKRASHFHIVYSMADEAEGKALRFTRSGDRDEMLARRLEIELGEALQPSTRVDRTVELLRERGLDDLAAIAATGPRAEKGQNRSKAERQQAKRLEADLDLLDARLLEAWRRTGGDIRLLPMELERLGFRLAAGDKLVAGVPLVRLIDTETLLASSLTHDLNCVRKATGDRTRLLEPQVGAIIGKLPPETAVKAELRREAPQRSATDLLGEFDRLVAETEADGEREEASKARKGRSRVAARLTADEQKDLHERQKLVRSRYRQRDRIRRARVNRAFLVAKLFGGREIRKAAFYLVAVGVFATGAGLIPALAAAGVAVAALPSYVGAKRLRAAADQAVIVERAEMAQAVREESQRFFRERAVARRVAEQQQRAREERMRAAQANRQRMAQAEQLRRQQQQMERQRRLTEMEAMARQRTVQATRLPGSGGQDPRGAGQAARRPVANRQRPRGGGVER